MHDSVQLWRSILTADAPAWVAFQADHCVLLPQPSHNPAQQAGSLLAKAPDTGEVAEHALGYLFITGEIFTLVRPEEVTDRSQVIEVALSKRKQRKVVHVELPVPLERLADLILRQAKTDLVEEIELEPLEHGGIIRFLREGAWFTAMQPPPGVIPRLIQHWMALKLRTSPGPWGDSARLALA